MKTTHRLSLVSLLFFADPASATTALTVVRIPAPPAFAIEYLLKHPTDSVCEAFDQRYGNGAAARYIGRRK